MTDMIRKAENWVMQLFEGDSTGHDWYHTDRVRKNALKIAEEEGADPFICELAALLHDAGDDKFHPSEEEGRNFVLNWLSQQDLSMKRVHQVMSVMDTVSFKGGHNSPPASLEGMVVQDADRLDAIGAIGVARCFMFAGHKGDAMYLPSEQPREDMTKEEYRLGASTAINHFYEKLLTLSSQMKTSTGREMAQRRHAYLEHFLEQFYEEWEGLR
ncbi:phosphohydrolase [Salipaludibacillus keqinensis]|uniref:Phosphohydrolase n=1 Tax=Salipaludibacillus keqinensis TaxID=2045207 RepID=A0A323TMF6_9BACI|nr:HD domain-containing protein [Salipaludibacillus keqinensis]PYZ95236.1 phosphohydrolase [Salipaludibacillus keqinensis]